MFVAGLESCESFLFAVCFDLLRELNLAANNTAEDFEVFLPVHLAVDSRGGIDFAHGGTDLLNDRSLSIGGLQLVLHFLHLRLCLLLAICQVGGLALLDVIVILEIEFPLGTLEVNQLDTVLQIKLVHHFGALNQDNNLGFLLVARLEGSQFCFALKLKCNLFEEHSFGEILANVFFGLTSDPLTLVILLDLSQRCWVLHGNLHRSLKVDLVNIEVLSGDLGHLKVDFLVLFGSLLDLSGVLLPLLCLEESESLVHHLFLDGHETLVSVLTDNPAQLDHVGGLQSAFHGLGEATDLVDLLQHGG